MPEVSTKNQHSLMQYFGYSHLPFNLQVASKPFYELAIAMDKELAECSQKDQTFNLLLQAKDCAVRALLHRA